MAIDSRLTDPQPEPQQAAVAAGSDPEVLAVPPDRPRKPGAVGCIFADAGVQVAERPPEEYAAYLEEL